MEGGPTGAGPGLSFFEGGVVGDFPSEIEGNPGLLFAYGTLGPSGLGTVERDGWSADAVRGRLYDLGRYPVLVDWDDPGAGWVEGHVRPLVRRELEDRLDPYEGVEEGLFRRIAATSRAGRRVWAYVYPHPVPPGARGPLTRWEGPGAADDSDLAPTQSVPDR